MHIACTNPCRNLQVEIGVKNIIIESQKPHFYLSSFSSISALQVHGNCAGLSGNTLRHPNALGSLNPNYILVA